MQTAKSHSLQFGPSRRLRIGIVNSADVGGGAEQVATCLLSGLRARGHEAWLAVGQRRSHSELVLPVPAHGVAAPARRPFRFLEQRLRNHTEEFTWLKRPAVWLDALARAAFLDRLRGIEDFHYASARQILSLFPTELDLLHCHNLHGDYFDLSALPRLSHRVPTLLTLHDAWLLSGHCAHSLNCERWLTGCGACPDLTLYPSIRADATAENWERKRRIYSESRLYVATPSRWLMDKVERSILNPAIVQRRVIPNGVDLELFRGGNRMRARSELGLPVDSVIVLFSAFGGRANPWKDFSTIHEAVKLVSSRLSAAARLHVIALGDTGNREAIGSAVLEPVPFVPDRASVARYFQAADIYAHSSRADTFPTAIIESLACGTPVVATAVGGIPEQVHPLNDVSSRVPGDGLDSATGVLVAPADINAFATALEVLVRDRDLRIRLGNNAAQDARVRFGVEKHIDAYVKWYLEIIDSWATNA